MDSYDKDFNLYLEKFKNLSTKEKESIVYDHLKLLASLTSNYCRLVGANNSLLINKELIDMNNENYTHDDFCESLITLINSIQKSVCDYHEKLYSVFKHAVEMIPESPEDNTM